MAQDQLKSILNYVKDVLGVESFAIASAAADLSSGQELRTAPKPYLFVGSYSSNQVALNELQSRMVAALKLNVADFDFINLEQTNVQRELISGAKVVVIFGDETRKTLALNDLKLGEVKADASQKIIYTHSLTELLNSAPLKKETWTHLQSVF